MLHLRCGHVGDGRHLHPRFSHDLVEALLLLLAASKDQNRLLGDGDACWRDASQNATGSASDAPLNRRPELASCARKALPRPHCVCRPLPLRPQLLGPLGPYALPDLGSGESCP